MEGTTYLSRMEREVLKNFNPEEKEAYKKLDLQLKEKYISSIRLMPLTALTCDEAKGRERFRNWAEYGDSLVGPLERALEEVYKKGPEVHHRLSHLRSIAKRI